MMKVKYN